MSQNRGAYALEFQQQIIELVKSGRKPKDLAAEFGCHVTSIFEWVRQARIDEQGKAGEELLTTAERQELIRLRRQLRQVTMEGDILAKAKAWFANKGTGGIVVSISSHPTILKGGLEIQKNFCARQQV